jgi:hypothetical protein
MNDTYSVLYKFSDLDTFTKHLSEIDYIFGSNPSYNHSHQSFVSSTGFVVRHNFKQIKRI